VPNELKYTVPKKVYATRKVFTLWHFWFVDKQMDVFEGGGGEDIRIVGLRVKEGLRLLWIGI